MKKNIWILNHYATNHFNECGGRHFWISEQLKIRGYVPTVFGASQLHGSDDKYAVIDGVYKVVETEIGVPLLLVKVRPEYKGGVHRVLNMVDYYRNAVKAGRDYAKKNGKPDVIYASSVHPLALLAGEKLAKIFKVPCICEVRDLWPETMVLMGIWKRNIITHFMYLGERYIYKKAEALIFTMEGAADYIKNKGWDNQSGGCIDISKVYHVNNGVDIERFHSNAKNYIYNDDDLDSNEKFIVNYTGSIRAANNVDSLVNAAKELKKLGNDKVKILIWGNGDYVDTLCEKIEASNLNNIEYKGAVKKVFIPSILVRGNINVYTFRDGGTKYGIDLNKCFEYLASGKPIIGNDETLYSVIEKYNCGVERKMEAYELASVINDISNLPIEDYRILCDNAKNAAKDYDFSVLTEKIVQIIESL